jgi:tetratricopeptide (TPR) repeat protein
VWCTAAFLLLCTTPALTQATQPAAPSLLAAQDLFYNAKYPEAAAMALAVREAQPEELAGYELRTSALHFQIKRAIGDAPDKTKALAACAVCAGVLAAFSAETTLGQALARKRLAADPNDETAKFYLGKLDLNHVWLYLGTLGRKTGWDEYWEARRTLDSVLQTNPNHVRARVARAWVDYIVGTKVPWGTRWMLGGGNKKKALTTVREAAQATTDFYERAEARFALWELLVREKRVAEAVAAARELQEQFPANPELARFIEQHPTTPRR